jgi:tetratricopeptide (TPR) repeat protein
METDILPFWDAPEEKRPFFMRVVLPYKNALWTEVDRIAQLWIKEEPETTEAFYYAGIANEKLGQLDKAKQYYQQSLSLQPDHPAATLGLQCIKKVVLACNQRN